MINRICPKCGQVIGIKWGIDGPYVRLCENCNEMVTVMRIICCKCGLIIGTKPGEGDTHGWCDDCYAEQMRYIERYIYDESLREDPEYLPVNQR